MTDNNNKIKLYGVIIGVLTFVFQHAVYLAGNFMAGVIGNEPFSPKIDMIDGAIPLWPIFILPYVWAYPYWLMAPMAASKCEKKHFHNYIAAYILALLAGGVVLALAPTRMDRVAEGLFDMSLTGFCPDLMRFWYSIDGGEIAYNLLPSFHCINSTIAYLGVAGRPEVPRWFRIYSLVITLLIYVATMFVKQHYFLDVVSGVAIAVICWFIVVKFNLGRFAWWSTGFRRQSAQ